MIVSRLANNETSFSYFLYWLEYPKKTSKILAGSKPEDEVGARRAQKFMDNCDQITMLREQRRHGSIADKDLSKWQLRFE